MKEIKCWLDSISLPPAKLQVKRKNTYHLINKAFEDPSKTFVRSFSYRSPDIGRMSDICKTVTDIKKEIQKREQERVTKAGLVEQDDLEVIKGRRPPRIPDVFIRPNMEGKRYAGDLEIHVNGLRYQSSVRSEQKIDILFSNIKRIQMLMYRLLFPAL